MVWGNIMFRGGYMQKFIISGLTVVLILVAPVAFAATITGTAPQLRVYISQNWHTINVETEFDNAIIDANNELAKYKDQKDLTTGFANANMYSTSAATQQGYPNYSLFAVTTGVMVGVQAPTTNIDYYTGGKMEDDIKAKGDLYAGVAGSVAINVGINIGFLVPGLYINGKFGKFDSAWVYDNDDFSFNTFIAGVGVQYSLFDAIGTGLLRWRGLMVGSGLVYQSTKVAYKVNLDKEVVHFTDNPGGQNLEGDVVVDPSFKITLDMYTLSVPLELTTAVQFLWLFNLTLGAGVDVVTGNADLVLKAAADATVDNIAVGGTPISKSDYQVTPGNLTIDGSTLGKKPSLARARVMTGVGFNLGPVKIDVPIIYYFKSGAAVGVTAGIVW
jgi:hypothetical protein